MGGAHPAGAAGTNAEVDMETTEPPRESRAVRLAQRYWQQAQADLHSAKMNLLPGSYYVAANLSHQAAEKALKAAHLHSRAEEAPWSHDLSQLAERIAMRAQDIPPEVRTAASYLDPLFAQTRYPSSDLEEPIPSVLVDQAIAEQAINSAEEVMSWVQSLLALPPGRPQRKRTS
jgi:HEPN domain-containing protein